MILDILIICSLISSSPYYDCSEQWMIEIYNTPVPCFEGNEFVLAAGCTNLNSKNIKVYTIYEYEKELKDRFSALEHELEHLKCMCNFH